MYSLFRPFLFRLDPETAHRLTLQLVRQAGLFPPARILLQGIFSAPEKPVEVLGLKFQNPVGLAAGYDKDGVAIRGLAALGFGHIEIGTVTVRPQLGNPRPCVFRLVEDQAVINRMGFPGLGAAVVANNVSTLAHSNVQTRKRANVMIGANLGKNKDTPLENASADYIALLQAFFPLADYLTINISSPNTEGLRRLQGRAMLEKLLDSIAKERLTWNVHRPILVKLSPDLNNEELDDALDAILRTGMDGVIATNTTLARAGLRSHHQNETGGLSGAPLRSQSETMLGQVLKRLAGRIPVIRVGGIMSPADAKRRLDMGAALVQIYTGLIYAGPGLVQKILRGI
jgi:dihydroorotate dehydrogenase